MSFEKDTARRKEMINEKVPGFLRNAFTQFAGTEGTERHSSFKNGKFEYWSYMLKKLN